ncbi:alanine racemase, partial [Chloroflexota bacterium]
IVIDTIEQADKISKIGQELSIRIPVLIKLDTGVHRFGVRPGKPTLDLVRKLAKLKGIKILGIYAHEAGAVPTEEGVTQMALEVGSVTAETARMIRGNGFEIEEVSVGSSPTYRATCRLVKEGLLTDITEIHAGACAIGDIMYMRFFGNTRDTCAVTVLVTVVGTSHKSHAVIDAGFKTFGKDSLIEQRNSPGFFWNDKPSFGSVQDLKDLWLGRLAAETGWLYYTNPRAPKLKTGDRLEIVPNNVTLTINLHDHMYAVRKGEIEKDIPITGRGLGY